MRAAAQSWLVGLRRSLASLMGRRPGKGCQTHQTGRGQRRRQHQVYRGGFGVKSSSVQLPASPPTEVASAVINYAWASNPSVSDHASPDRQGGTRQGHRGYEAWVLPSPAPRLYPATLTVMRCLLYHLSHSAIGCNQLHGRVKGCCIRLSDAFFTDLMLIRRASGGRAVASLSWALRHTY